MPKLFQSHCGAIATPAPKGAGRHPTAFNPTVVRLRRKQDEEWVEVNPPFNPTVVRLRRAEAEVALKHISFQSHCGAIATVPVPSPTHLLPPFNPTVVRLRPYNSDKRLDR